MYKQIVESIAEYFKNNQLFINGQLITPVKEKQYKDTFLGISFAYDSANIEKIVIFICPYIEYDEKMNIFLEINPIYKDNRGIEGFIYKNMLFPLHVEQVETFCKLLINEYIPNILANKHILTLGEKSGSIPF